MMMMMKMDDVNTIHAMYETNAIQILTFSSYVINNKDIIGSYDVLLSFKHKVYYRKQAIILILQLNRLFV